MFASLVPWSLVLALQPAALAADPDWKAAGDEAASVLAQYLQVDTVNPDGNEDRAVAFLGGILDREGIPWVSYSFAPGRSSLVARLKGSGAEPPLCLVSHTDVVPSEPSFWPPDRPPLGGVVADGYVWGRGALDMKGMGVLELQTMIALKRQGVPLRHDVILLAVGDEEVGSGGMNDIVANHWAEIGCSQSINEGGMGIRDLLFKGQTLYGISVAEKGIAWVDMVATGPAGHGSRPAPEQAPHVLTRAAALLEAYDPKPRWHWSLLELFKNVAPTQKGLTRMVLGSTGLTKLALRERFMADPATRAELINTINLTNFSGGSSPNVVPTEVHATLDCRLLPGTTPEDMLALLRSMVPDPAIRFSLLQGRLSNESPTEDSLYQALARAAVTDASGAARADAVAGPILSVGFTDSLLLRPLGVHAYGFVPFEVSLDEAVTMHGHGERVSVDNLREGLRILYAAVAEVSRAGSPS
jgi:acetylornithine deacetylase/succinyl-diaminopimelate desuccinylase-like protein